MVCLRFTLPSPTFTMKPMLQINGLPLVYHLLLLTCNLGLKLMVYSGYSPNSEGG